MDKCGNGWALAQRSLILAAASFAAQTSEMLNVWCFTMGTSYATAINGASGLSGTAGYEKSKERAMEEIEKNLKEGLVRQEVRSIRSSGGDVICPYWDQPPIAIFLLVNKIYRKQ